MKAATAICTGAIVAVDENVRMPWKILPNDITIIIEEAATNGKVAEETRIVEKADEDWTEEKVDETLIETKTPIDVVIDTLRNDIWIAQIGQMETRKTTVLDAVIDMLQNGIWTDQIEMKTTTKLDIVIDTLQNAIWIDQIEMKTTTTIDAVIDIWIDKSRNERMIQTRRWSHPPLKAPWTCR